MEDYEQTVRDYFQASSDFFWQWQDDGNVAGWRDGKLIAFDAELTSILTSLVPEGLPRFGSLLLLIAATRDNWATDGSEVGMLTSMLESMQHLGEGSQASEDPQTRSNRHALLQRVLTGLHNVRSLDSSLRATLEAKAALAAIVFDGCKAAVPKLHSTHVAAAIRPGLLSLLTSSDAVAIGYGPISLVRDLSDLAHGLQRVTPDAVLLRLKTGVEALPISATVVADEEGPETLRVSESARAVIQQLLESPEHSGLAKLAKQLTASTTLPRRLSAPEEQEMGGYSDIANRGTPDRLLLSELAQDGLTLAVRVAMNEAMYLHRETPPSPPRLRRELLIDTGVHTWGLPRLFAASAALAFAASTRVGGQFTAWRTEGPDLKEVDLFSKEGLVEHLAALRPDPHLGEAMPRFAEKIAASEDPVEAVLIMPADAWEDPAVRLAIQSLAAERLYLATVTREGKFFLAERTARGEKLLRQAELSLDELVPSAATLKETRELDRLPAIFRSHPFPLLMPVSLDSKTCWTVGKWGALSITGDGRLMRWTNARKGAQQLCDDLPKGQLHWMLPDVSEAGVTQFVYGPSVDPTLFTIDLENQEVLQTTLKCDSRGIVDAGGVFLGIQSDYVVVLNPQTGEAGAKLAVPKSLRWVGGRYFQDKITNAWLVLSHDGLAATIDPLPPFEVTNDPVIRVWDANGYNEPIALTSTGRLLSSKNDRDKLPRKTHPIHNCQVLEISHDGKRLLVTGDSRVEKFEIFLAQPYRFGPHYGSPVDRRVVSVARPESIRKKFKSIGVTRQGELALRTNKGLVVLETHGDLPILRQHPRSTHTDHEEHFFDMASTEGIRYRLAVATWPGGAQAVLDSRGLLHLQPVNDTTPEVTLVLSEGAVAFWQNHGGAYGRDYFVPDRDKPISPRASVRQVLSGTVRQFIEDICA